MNKTTEQEITHIHQATNETTNETINQAFDNNDLSHPSLHQAVEQVISGLTQGQLRVAQKVENDWVTNAWIKKAILLYFRLQKMEPIKGGELEYLDKIPTQKFSLEQGVRVVPPAVVRTGAHIEKGAILMPSFVNIGAYVGANTMVDTWATVGSCAQIGANVHLSGGVGIGGVLEPAQAQPVIVEDHVFVGSRCILVEGVRVCEGAVIGAGVTITGSTKIIDVTKATPEIHSAYVPPHSVVIPGVQEKQFAAGKYGVPCALIIGKRNASTDKKTSLNMAIREFGVSV